jgi:hypothetical protein
MKRHLIAILAALLLSAGTLYAQAGTTGFSFLKVGTGSRALGMGEASVASATDPSAAYYNPASIALAGAPQILLMHREWVEGSHTDFLGATTSAGLFHAGLGVTSFAVDDIEVRTAPGAALSTFSARNAAISLSGAYDLSSALSIGASAKFLYEKIFVDDASGLAFDLGGVYRIDPAFTLGASVSNLGSVSELRNEASTLPTILRFGGAYTTGVESLDGVITGSADLVSMSAEGRSHLHVGVEAEFKKLFALRAGAQTGYEAKSISLGMGVRQGMFRFDYAYVPFSLDMGSTHTLALLFTFL